ncbi:Transcription factor SPT20 [Balamuthia mandrillaris]
MEEEEEEEEEPTHPSGRAANGQRSIGTSDMHATQREQRSRKNRDVEEERDKAAEEEEEEEEEDYDYVPSPVMDSMELFPELSAEASAFVDNISTRTRARQPLPDIDFQQLEDMLQEVDDPFEANPQEEDYLRFLFELQDKQPPDATVQPTMTIEEDDDDDYCFQPEEEEEEDTTSQHGMDDEWEIDPEEIEALLSQLEAEQQQQLQQAQQEQLQQQQQKQLAATKPIAAAVPIQPLYTHNVFTSDQLVQLQCQLSQHFQLLLQTVFHSLGDKESEPAETAWNLLVEMWGCRDAVIPNNPQLQSSSKPLSAPSIPSSPLRFLTTPTTEPSLSVRRSPRRRPPPPPSSSSPSSTSTPFSLRTVIPLPSSLLSITKFETEIPTRNKPTLMWCNTRSLFDVPGLHLVPALGSLLNACGWKAAYSRRVLPCPYDYASRSLGVFPPFSQKESLHLLDLFEPFFDPAIKPKRLARKNRRLTFTPAEDDLLLLGLQKYGNKGMAKTQSNLLPTKTVKQLRNRYKNRISGKAEWNSIKAFKEGSRLQCQNPLTQTELQLLTQGVMLYGFDWKTIAFRMLPRRQPHHLSFVWNHLRNLHPSLSSSTTAAPSSSSSSTTPVTSIAPSSVAASSSAAFVSSSDASFAPSASLSTRANPTQTGITPILPPFNALRLPLPPPAVVPPPSIIPVTASSSSLPVTTISTSATPSLKSSLSSSVFPLPLLGALHFENEDIIDSSESDHEDEEKEQEDGDTDDILLYSKDSAKNKTPASVNTKKEASQNASVPRPSSSPSSLASTTKQMFEEEDLFDSDEEEEEKVESDDDNKK